MVDKLDVFALPVFWLADRLPMFDAEDSAALAEDIKTNGLNNPIVIGRVDGTMMLIDGRDRRAACKKLGIKPEYRELNGQDVVRFVISENVRRKSRNKGQVAMLEALADPEPAKLKRGSKLNLQQTDKMYLSMARAVLKDSRESADQVLDGTLMLTKAHAALDLKAGKSRQNRMRLTKLRQDRADLADRVEDDNDDLDLEAAIKIEKDDADKLKQQRWAATMNIIDAIVPLDRSLDNIDEIVEMFDPTVAAGRGEEVTPERLKNCADYLLAYADALKESEEE